MTKQLESLAEELQLCSLELGELEHNVTPSVIRIRHTRQRIQTVARELESLAKSSNHTTESLKRLNEL